MELFNWKLKEEDLHEYIISAYESKGYECTNFHGSGASVEGGVDILAEKDNEKIAFCVKIKPVKSDADQLKKFYETPFNKKVYVFIKDPTRPFYDELSKYPEMEIFNSKDLDLLFKNTKVEEYLKRYFYSHNLFREIEKIISILHSSKECKNGNLNISDFNLLWELKDRAVSFNKSSQTMFDMNNIRFKSVYDDPENKILFELIDHLEECLDYLKKYAERLRVQFKEVKKKNPAILSYFWMVCKPRSNWFELLGPLNELPSDQIPRWFFHFFFKRMPSSFIYGLLIWILEEMQNVAEGLEDGVDWTLQDILNKGK